MSFVIFDYFERDPENDRVHVSSQG
jgi:hypothetical protein